MHKFNVFFFLWVKSGKNVFEVHKSNATILLFFLNSSTADTKLGCNRNLACVILLKYLEVYYKIFKYTKDLVQYPYCKVD